MPGPNEVPTEEVVALQGQGKNTSDITQELQTKGYSLQQINEAINQASIKSGVGGSEAPPPVAPNAPPITEMQESMLVPPPAAPAAPAAPAPEPAPAPAAPMPAAPAMPPMQPAMPAAESGASYEDIQALVEEVIDEKWKELMTSIGDIPTWKTEMGNDIESIKQELLRVEKRFEDLQAAIFGKVKEYGSTMQDLGTDMKALEQVFQKIIGPMTTNIKELEEITTRLKGKK